MREADTCGRPRPRDDRDRPGAIAMAISVLFDAIRCFIDD
jgi:hypothetical protein